MLGLSFLRSIKYINLDSQIWILTLDFIFGEPQFSFFNIYHPPTAIPTMTIFPIIPEADNRGITKAVAKSNDYNHGPIKYPL